MALHLFVGIIIVLVGLIPLGWAFGLYGPRWFLKRLGFVRTIVGWASGLLILIGLSTAFG